MQKPAEELDLRVFKSIHVKAPIERAFSVFVEQMESWWPATHHIGKTPFEAIFIEPRVGGRWYERGDDGSTCQWGSVLAWEPHTRLLLSWDISADWQYDPALKTEVELRFTAEGSDRTRVELEHRRLDRYGARRDEMRRIFDKDGDWGKFLELFARAAAEA